MLHSLHQQQIFQAALKLINILNILYYYLHYTIVFKYLQNYSEIKIYIEAIVSNTIKIFLLDVVCKFMQFPRLTSLSAQNIEICINTIKLHP